MAPSLISTDVFPGDDMSPESIGEAASMIRFVGDQVAADSADVVKTWSAIAGSYDAPEAGQLVAAMNPVKTSGDTFDSHLGSAADALVTFADEVRTIKKTLEGLRGEANAMLATIDGNGKVGAGGIGPGTDWWHDPVTFHHNEDLITAVAAQADLLKAAESRCAGAIESLVDGGGRHGENGGPGFSTVTAPTVEDAPWGHVMTGQEMNELWEQEAPGWERGASKNVLEAVGGLAKVGGFDTSQFDASSGLPHGKLFGDWSVHNSVTTIEGIAAMLFQHPVRTVTGGVKDFFAVGDWDRPSFAIGEVGANLAMLGLASTKVTSLGKVGAAGREAVDAAGAGKAAVPAAEASRLARLAGVGQRVGNKVTVPTVDGLKNLARTADTTWTKTLDRLNHTVKALHGIKAEKASTAQPHVPEVHDAPAAKNHSGPTASRAGSEASEHHSGSGDDSSLDGPGSDHPRSAPLDSGHLGDDTKPDSAPGTQHPDAHELKGQHRFPDVNSTDVDALHHVVHKDFVFKMTPAYEGPSLADARVSVRIHHLDDLHHRNALARAEGVDPKELTVKKRVETLGRLRDEATTPAELRRVRALADATSEEYKTGRQLHEISERMGTEAGKAFHQSEKETLIAGDHDRPGRRNELDTVGINEPRTVLDVVEEKGGTAGLGTRKLDNGVEVEQGSTAYLNKMLHIDAELTDHFKKHPEDVQRLIDGDMELRYHVLYAMPDGTIRVERLKLNPDELHFEDLLPPPPPAAAPVLPDPVRQPR